jgi:hypothetical protein
MQVCSAAILGLATTRRRRPWSGPRALEFPMANWMSVLVEAVQVVERQVQTRPRCKRCRRTRSWCPTLPVRRFVQLPRPCHSDTSQTLSSSLNSSSSFIDLFFFQCTNQLPYIVTHRDVNGSNRIGFCYFHIIYHIFVADLIEADNDRMRI